MFQKKRPKQQDTSLARNSGQDANACPDDEAPIDLTRSLNRALKNPLAEQPKETTQKIRDEIVTMLATIESAFFVIDDVREKVLEASHVALKASADDDLGHRGLLAERYDDIRVAIDKRVSEADSSAFDLLGEPGKDLALTMGRITYTIPAARLDCTEAGLNLPPPKTGFCENEEVSNILLRLERALERLDRVATQLMSDAKFLTTKFESVSL